MGLQTIVIHTLNDSTHVEISAAPLDVDTTGNGAGINLVRGVPVREFGIDNTGPYYQIGGADPGEVAALGYDPDADLLYLVQGG